MEKELIVFWATKQEKEFLDILSRFLEADRSAALQYVIRVAVESANRTGLIEVGKEH